LSTSLILAVAIATAVPLGLSASVWLAEYSKQSGKVAGGIRLSLDVLAGVPSIVLACSAMRSSACIWGWAFPSSPAD
jgi:ABC-type phosphate transport system permease subunit